MELTNKYKTLKEFQEMLNKSEIYKLDESELSKDKLSKGLLTLNKELDKARERAMELALQIDEQNTKSPKKKETIIKIPLDTLYFQEFVNELLKVYNTVSVQSDKDYYWIKLEEIIF